MTSPGQFKIVLALDSNIWMLLLIWLLEVASKKIYLGIFFYFFSLSFQYIFYLQTVQF